MRLTTYTLANLFRFRSHKLPKHIWVPKRTYVFFLNKNIKIEISIGKSIPAHMSEGPWKWNEMDTRDFMGDS